MKKKLLILTVLLAAMLLAVVSCVKDTRETSAGTQEGYADTESTADFLARAQQFFETTYSPEAKTRTAQHSPKTAELSALEVFPDWNRSRMSSSEETAYAEFPLLTERQYGINIEGDSAIRKVEQRLVVRKDRKTGHLEMYTSLLVPADRKSEKSLSKTALLRTGDFSGDIYLFTPDGQFYDGTRYEHGKITGGLIPSETTEAVQTRSYNPYGGCYGILYTIYYQDCYTVGGEYYWCSDWYIASQTLTIYCPEHVTGGDGTGGSGSTGTGSTGTPTPKPQRQRENRKNKTESDCSNNSITIRNEARDLIADFKTVTSHQFSENISYKESYESFLDKIDKNSGVEHSIEIQSFDGFPYVIDSVVSGERAWVSLLHSSHTVGNVHYHPEGGPPSALDLITAGDIAGKHSLYQGSAVLLPDGTMYMISITDRQAAAAFSQKYASQVDIQGSNWFIKNSDIDRHLKQNKDYQKLDSNEKRMFELADVLAEYESGMRLVKVNPDGTRTYGFTENHKILFILIINQLLKTKSRKTSLNLFCYLKYWVYFWVLISAV